MELRGGPNTEETIRPLFIKKEFRSKTLLRERESITED